MATKEELQQSILDDAAAGVRLAVIDGNTVNLMSVSERQQALDKEESEDSKRSKNGGLQFRKLVTFGGLGT